MSARRASVKLHLYDLSQGMAKAMSMAIIGKQLDGIWHSGIAVFGVEYFYGGGICAAPAGRAIPHLQYQEIALGETSRTQQELEVFLQSINSRFTRATYSLLRHNCNNFANEVAMFLLGNGIPSHIIRLPQEFLSSPMGIALAPMIESMEQRMREDMVGEGRGLNPFGHIEGRSLAFPAPSSALLDEVSPPPPEVSWLDDTDLSLVKTALDGIPESIMSMDLKLKANVIDSAVSELLVDLIKTQFKDKTPILMTFNVLVRFYWKHESFRHHMQNDTHNTLERLISTSLKSNNSHVVLAALSAAVNLAASIDINSSKFLEPVLNPVIALAHSTKDFTSAQKKLHSQCLNNCLLTVPVDATTTAQSNFLIDACLDLIIRSFRESPELDSVKQIAQSLEIRASKLFEKGLAETFKSTLEPEPLVESIDEFQSAHGLSLHKTLMLFFQ